MSSTRCFSFFFFKRVLYSFLSIHLLSLENLRSFFSYLGLCYNFWQKDWMSSTRCSSFAILRRCMLYCFLSLHLSLENLHSENLNSAAIFDKKIGCRPHGVLRFPFLGDARSVLFFRFIYLWRILGYVTTIFGKIGELLRLDN